MRFSISAKRSDGEANVYPPWGGGGGCVLRQPTIKSTDSFEINLFTSSRSNPKMIPAKAELQWNGFAVLLSEKFN